MPDDGWDFQVQRINLHALNVDAGQKLGMVIAQPEYALAEPGHVAVLEVPGHERFQDAGV